MIEPKLRFKADDGSEFPDWEEKKFSEIFEKTTNKNTCYGTDKIISVANMYYKEDASVSNEDYLKTYNVMLYGDIAFEGHVNKEYSHGRFVLNDIGDGIVSHIFDVFHPKNLSLYSVGFWKEYIRHEPIMGRVLVRCTKSSTMMRNLVAKEFLQELVPVPCLEEQQKIADCLVSFDTVIEKQKETVSAWEERKKGVMQKLFSQEVRFKADDGSDFPEWEEKKLGDICKTFSGGTPKSGEARYYENGTISFIRSGEIHDDKTELRITKDGLNESSAKMVDIGDILYALYGATSGEVDISKIKGAINQAILCIRPLNDFHRKFIVEILRHNKETILRTYLQGGQGNLSAQIIQSLVYDFPCLAEQQKIADCLSSLDEVIEKQKATLSAWEELKKGLLQQMFV
ncbi:MULTISPECIES: restriction endonuclease subunit S [unclassified Candidatus Paralachnospira]|uniref:restriction endonuclease subunit S n=1 Tax=unclassified Candidatus Paralachnospira TaxID=3099471 RepID=UPI003F9108B4